MEKNGERKEKVNQKTKEKLKCINYRLPRQPNHKYEKL